MRDGWQTVKLVDACEVYQPKTISKKEMLPDAEFVVFGANGIIGRYDKFNHEEPQVLVTCRGATCGSINVSEPYAWITGNAMVIRPKADEFSKRYLEYYLRGAVDFTTVITGAAQPQITRQSLASVDFSFPPLAEQQRIVALLDQAFEGIDQAIANTEQNLASARELFDSYLNNIFTQRGDGWVEKKLGEVGTASYGYTAKATSEEVGPKFLRITDIQNGKVDWATVPYCPISESDKKKHLLKTNDIVFARTGATTGKSYMLDEPPESVAASYLIKLHITSDELLPHFVYLFFQTRDYWDRISKGTTGSAQGGFNASKLSNLVIPIPSKSEQQTAIAQSRALEEQTQQLEARYTQKLEDLKELKQSLLQKAFAGELTKEAVA